MIFQERLLKVLKCCNFLSVQQWHNCSPVVSFANCVMTLYLLKVHLQTFLSIPITQKCQILGCDTLVANERCVLYVQCIHFYRVYIHFSTIYLFISNAVKVYEISIIFGMVHSDRSVVLLLHKHSSSWLSTLCNFISINTNCMYAAMSESSILTYFSNMFTFFKLPYYVQFLFNTDAVFFTWIAMLV